MTPPQRRSGGATTRQSVFKPCRDRTDRSIHVGAVVNKGVALRMVSIKNLFG